MINESINQSRTTQLAQLLSLKFIYPDGREESISNFNSFKIPKHEAIGIASFNLEVHAIVSLNGTVSQVKIQDIQLTQIPSTNKCGCVYDS